MDQNLRIGSTFDTVVVGSHITVAICTYNGAERIIPCLQALHHQEIQFPVLLVDDGSTDGTLDVVRRGLDELTIHCDVLALGRNVGIWQARQSAIDACLSTFIVFIDDDCRPVAGWSRALLAAWNSSSSATHLVGGPTQSWRPLSLNSRYNDVFNTILPLDRRFGEPLSLISRLKLYALAPRVRAECVVSFLPGANLSARIESVRAIGGFPEMRGAGEDIFLCDAIRKTFGAESIWSFPDVLVEHDYGSHLSNTLKRSFYYGRAAGRRWLTHGGIPSVRPGPLLLSGVALTIWATFPTFFSLLSVPTGIYMLWLPQTWRETRKWRDRALFPLIRCVDESSQVISFVFTALRRWI